MPDSHAVTCQIQYRLNLDQIDAFEEYARTWIRLVERYGGAHHGYFLPRAIPYEPAVSFPGIGKKGPTNVAVAMFTFPDEETYRSYRRKVASDPDCMFATALVEKTGCFTSYERLFLTPTRRK